MKASLGEGVGRYTDAILSSLDSEPKTPNEVALKVGIHQRTAQIELLELVIKKPAQVGYKKIGRIHLFWLKKV